MQKSEEDNMLHAISPLDGRYKNIVAKLGDYFSEYALIRERVFIELKYILALNQTGLFPVLIEEEISRISNLAKNFNENDAIRIKQIELRINHDVKACEYFLREKLELKNSNMIHFGLTSEDVNNLSYTLLFRKFLINEQIPLLRNLISFLCDLASEWENIPFPARTHGQPASPTTAGKENAVYISRLLRILKELKAFKFLGKLNGATGNYSAMISAAPDFDWESFCFEFIKNLELLPNPATTQIEDHDTWARYFNLTRQLNNIILDLVQDAWLYIAFDFFKQKAKKDEVGSSTMPHKVNPIRFENSEGNLYISNSLLTLVSDKLCRSRMQRDLSDSTITRNVGVALSHSYLALTQALEGLKRIAINTEVCTGEIVKNIQILSEPVQTILRMQGEQDPYELLKNLTMGKRLDETKFHNFINSLNVSPEIKKRLLSLKTINYTGNASLICSKIISRAREELAG